MKPESLVTHPPKVKVEENNPPLVSPIYQSVKFTVESTEALKNRDNFFYSRLSNPTVRQLELLIAQLQGREDAIAVSTGIAAISCTLLSLLKAGDHVIMFLESYGPTRYLVTNLLARFGVTSTLLSFDDTAGLLKELKKQKTRLLMFECPTNPMTRIPDIDFITATARTHGALTVLDNTFSGPHNLSKVDVDLYVHSLTKFASGHGDVLGGVIVGNHKLLGPIRHECTELGPTLDAHAAYLILRGMKTYFLRYQRQCENALAVAQFLEKHPGVEKVFYPGLASHPEHARAKALLKDFGAIVTFDVKGAGKNCDTFLNKLKFLHLAASLGSTDSLAAPVKLFFASDYDEAHLKRVGITERTVRLAIGIENIEDILADLTGAL